MKLCRSIRPTHIHKPKPWLIAGAVEAWLVGKLRLCLEWLTVPMLLVALQLPHASLCYWLASGLATLGQHHLLRLPAVRCCNTFRAGCNAPDNGTCKAIGDMCP